MLLYLKSPRTMHDISLHKKDRQCLNVSERIPGPQTLDSETKVHASETYCATSFTNSTRTNSNSFCACAACDKKICLPFCLDIACIVQREWQMSSLFDVSHVLWFLKQCFECADSFQYRVCSCKEHILPPPLVSEPASQGLAFHLKSTFPVVQFWQKKLAHGGCLPQQKTPMRNIRQEPSWCNWTETEISLQLEKSLSDFQHGWKDISSQVCEMHVRLQPAPQARDMRKNTERLATRLGCKGKFLAKYDLDVQDSRRCGWKETIQDSWMISNDCFFPNWSLGRKTGCRLAASCLSLNSKTKKTARKFLCCSRLWFRSQHTRALHSIWNRPFLWSSFGRRNWLTVDACHNKRLQCEIFGRNRVRAIDLQFQIVLPFRLHGPFFSGVQKALAR